MVLLKRLAAGLAIILGCVGGCATPRQQAPEVDPNTLGDVEFQAYLAETPLVTVDETYRAMLILADGEDTSKSFEERREKLESRGIARAQWKLEPNNLIEKGTVAYMLCRICRIRGGINMMVFGSMGLGDRHYALRELVYEGIAEDTSEWSYVRGGELVALLSKADEYMRKHKVYEGTPIELPPEPTPGSAPEWEQPGADVTTEPPAEGRTYGGEDEPESPGVGTTQPAAP